MQALTAKQKARVAKAPKGQKGNLLRGYARQNATAKSASRPTPPAKPPPRAKAQPKFSARGTHAVRRGVGYYDAFRHSPGVIAFPASMGEATPVKSVCRFTTPASSGSVSNGPLLVCVFNDVAGGLVAQTFNIADKTNTDNPVLTQFRASQFGNIASDTPFIPIRQSVRVTNTTEVMYRGGTVRVLRFNNLHPRFRTYSAGSYTDTSHPERTTVGHVKELAEMIRDSPKARTLGAAELGSARQWNSYITDLVGSSVFVDRTLPDSAWTSSGDGKWSVSGAASQPMSTLCFLFEPHGTENNTFEFAIMSQRLYRFPYGTLMASFAVDVPHMSHEIAHKIKSTEEQHENNAGKIVETGAAAGIASTLASKMPSSATVAEYLGGMFETGASSALTDIATADRKSVV